MTTTYRYTNTLTIVECAACHMDFGVQELFVRDRRRDHKSFYCPAGHSNFYPQTSDVESLRRRLQSAEATATHYRDQLDAERRSKAAVRGHLTRVKRRIANGVCPCCNRTFANVTRHMTSQHPEFDPGEWPWFLRRREFPEVPAEVRA